ncbi:unnamed protein product [Schistosoma turkestanicum]|nr:unnamed protein product [Schistosoma turkestanicum]
MPQNQRKLEDAEQEEEEEFTDVQARKKYVKFLKKLSPVVNIIIKIIEDVNKKSQDDEKEPNDSIDLLTRNRSVNITKKIPSVWKIVIKTVEDEIGKSEDTEIYDEELTEKESREKYFNFLKILLLILSLIIKSDRGRIRKLKDVEMMVEHLKEPPTSKGKYLILISLMSILQNIKEIFHDEIIDSDDVLNNLSLFTQIKLLFKFMKIDCDLIKTEYRYEKIVSQINRKCDKASKNNKEIIRKLNRETYVQVVKCLSSTLKNCIECCQYVLPYSVNNRTEDMLCSAILIAKTFRRILREIIMRDCRL